MKTRQEKFVILKFTDINRRIFIEKIKIVERPGNSPNGMLGVLGKLEFVE